MVDGVLAEDNLLVYDGININLAQEIQVKALVDDGGEKSSTGSSDGVDLLSGIVNLFENEIVMIDDDSPIRVETSNICTALFCQLASSFMCVFW